MGPNALNSVYTYYHYLLPTLAAGLFLSWYSLTELERPICRCRPWEPCWPTEKLWSGLNTSIGGNLVRLKPVGYVCSGPTFDQGACGGLRLLNRNSSWRASNPGTLQDWVWESGSLQNDTCFLRSLSANSLCSQGRIPSYSAVVRSPRHVQTAVLFAKTNNLRLVIKNTGHDTSGRSSSPNSFQIHTNFLKGIQYHSNFTVQGAMKPTGPAVTMGAGVMHGEIYAQGAIDGFMVVGGECPTVGAAGGFLQGGGVSSFHSHKRGLAVDNVLQYQVVDFKGEIVTANEYHNPDLFWALKGGGGGTFGVVTEATVRAYPDDLGVVSAISISTPRENIDQFWSVGVAGLLNILQNFNNENIAGQFLLITPTEVVEASLTLYFVNITNIKSVESRVQTQLASFITEGVISKTVTTNFQSKLSSEARIAADIYPDDYGILTGSMLIGNRLFNSPEGPSFIAEKISNLPMGPKDILFTSNLGGQVTSNKNVVDIALNPAWRFSAQLINFVRAVNYSIEGKYSALEDLTNLQMPVLYSLEPDFKVSYRNLGDPHQRDFQNVYWGSENYQRLLSIKRKVDPEELFITRLGVGSEQWDEEGMCKRERNSPFRPWRSI